MAAITGTPLNDVITEEDLSTGMIGGIPSVLPDLIDGLSGNDYIDGSGGNDTLYGGMGDDTLYGGDDNDFLDNNTSTGSGNDSLVGGGGNDTIFAFQDDTIDAGDGNDLIRVWSDQAYTLQGGRGTDTISVASFLWMIGRNFSLTENGIEIIEANGREIRGGAFNNNLNFSGIRLNRVQFIDLQEGDDTVSGLGMAIDVRGGDGNDSLSGSLGNDTFAGGSGDDILLGGDGNDILDPNDFQATGNDFLSGGAGNDTILAYQNDTIEAGDGDDLIRVWSDQAYSLQGGLGMDTITFADSFWIIGPNFSLIGNGVEVIEANGKEIRGGRVDNNLNLSGIYLKRVSYLDLEDGNDTVSGFGAAIDARGGSGNDSMDGSNGNDSLYGGSGDDTLRGGEGDDLLDDESNGNGTGNDSLVGGGGNDTIFAFQNDTIDAGDGDDLIRVWDDQAYNLQGGNGKDTLTILNSSWIISPSFSLANNGIEVVEAKGKPIFGGSANNNLNLTGISLIRLPFIDLQAGNDTLAGLDQALEVRGGDGNDSIVASVGNNSLYGGSGNDILIGGSGNDILDDEFNGSGNDSISAGLGNDTIFGFQSDTIDGGEGDDLIRVWNDQSYSLQGGAGLDTVSISSTFWLIGSSFSLATNGIENIEANGKEIRGGNINNTLDFSGISLNQVSFFDLQDGADFASGFSTSVEIRGGSGNDVLEGSSGSDSLYGGIGDDTLRGGDGDDILDNETNGNGIGNDFLIGGGGNDTIFAFQNDTIDAGDGDDWLRIWDDRSYSIQGGIGSDTVSIDGSRWIINTTFSKATNGIEVIEGNGKEIYGENDNNVIDFSEILLRNVKFIDLQDGNDSVIGSSSADDLRGQRGDDTLLGGDGDDTLRGDLGIDSFDGGGGSDTIDYSFTGDGGVIALPTGISTLGGSPELFTSMENVLGSNGNDTITGSTGNNRLEGNFGDDSIQGGSGNDTLNGGFGVDSLDGGTGSDTVDYSYLSSAGQVVVDLKLATATITGGETNTESLISFENAIGGAGNDILRGTEAVNRLEGLDGNDSLFGDVGNDTLIGGLGTDTLNGDSGIDTIDYRYTSRLLLGGVINLATGTANMGGTDLDTLIGIEWVIGSEGRDTIVGSDLANQLDGQRSADSILGGLGNDTLLGGLGNDTLDGEGDNDSILGGNGNDWIVGGGGNDTLQGNANIDTLSGGTGDDLYLFDGSTDIFIELATQGIDRVLASASFSLANGDNIENVTLDGISDIQATGNELNNSIVGNAGANALMGLSGQDTLNGGAGNDTLEGGSGKDSLNGGADVDTAAYSNARSAVTVSLAISAAQNTLGAGTDTLTAIENLLGSAFADKLTGNAGNNLLNGGAGNDLLQGGAGDDTLLGGADGDTVTYSNAPAAVIVSLATATAQNTFGDGTDLLVSIENLTGSAFADTLTGNSGNNLLTGSLGNDVLDGGAGNDTLDGGLGDDTLRGGADGDTATYGSAPAAVTVSLATAAAQNTVGAGTDLLAAIENLTGSAFADTLTGNSGNNFLSGGGGNDTLEGGVGNDTLNGGADVDTASYAGASAPVTVSLAITTAQNTLGAGTETLTAIENLAGTAFADRLTGSSGNNVLIGQGGNDTLQGGAGADTLIGGGGSDSLDGGVGADAFRFLAPSDGVDTITTFQAGTDRIEVVFSAFGNLPLGALLPTQLISGLPMGSDPVFLYNTSTGALAFDPDGSGAAASIPFATLAGAPALTPNDILVVGA